MSTIYSIRKLRRDGDTVAEIARKTGAPEPTVRKHMKMNHMRWAIGCRWTGRFVLGGGRYGR